MASSFRDAFAKKAVLLPLIVVSIVFFACLAMAVIGYAIGQDGLSKATDAQLETLASSREGLLDARLSSAVADLSSISNGTAVRQVIQQIGPLLRLSADNSHIKEYFSAGDTPEERASLNGEELGEMYTHLHAQVHGGFYTIWKNAGYGDIYILDKDGNVAYSVAKSDDFLPTADDDRVGTTALNALFQEVAQSAAGSQLASDFSAYSFNNNVPALFLMQPVWMGDTGTPVFRGAVAIRLDASYFNAVLGSTGGLGETGQTFMTTAEGVVVSDLPREPNVQPLSAKRTYEVIGRAITEGTTVSATEQRPDGEAMMLAATPMSILGKTFAVVAERSVYESLGAVRSMAVGLLVGGLCVLALAIAISIVVSRFITKPITRLTDTMKTMAEGNYHIDIKGVTGRDELGDMARAVEVFRGNGLKVASMTAEEEEEAKRRRAERIEMMQSLRRSFGEVVEAAIEGDFSRRVAAEFSDAELNALADSVNGLVATVDRGLGETGQVLSALADTDLTLRVNGDYLGAFAQLKNDTNRVADKLSEVVRQLRETSRGVKLATGEILSGANDLSERTTKQAAAIEETSATMEHLAGTVLENAKKAQNASGNARDLSRTAEDGAAVMVRANGAMERITASSSKIFNVIDMIDDIAFQTNLLALNASVEAARAGDAGKGFAVVAVEVRRLAQSAAEASSEVKHLIEQSTTDVGEGSKLVAEATRKLEMMLEAARASNVLMEAIAQESREQASAIEEVNAAVRQMDEMTQHNSALVEETNAAIEQTEARASELDRIVEVFRLDAQGDAISMGATRRAPVGSIKGLQGKTVAARPYLANGNAAISEEWTQF